MVSKSSPKNWGLYDVYVEQWDTENDLQKWLWHAETDTLHSIGHNQAQFLKSTSADMIGSNVMFEGLTGESSGVHNLITKPHAKHLGERSIMHYHPKTKHWVSEVSGRKIGFDWDNWLADESVKAFGKEHESENGMKWNIFHCDGKK